MSSKQKHLNIVSLNVPYPPNYGGVIDIFHKVRALHQIGIRIHLHCFDYGRGEQQALLQHCEKVFYYKRRTGFTGNLSWLPYIIYSRRNKKLLQNLGKNSYPILFDGLHTTYHLIKKRLKNRQVIIRFHNIEHEYYGFLARREQNVIKRLYYSKESYLLRKVLKKLPHQSFMAAISPSDTDQLKKHFRHVFWLPPFHPFDKLASVPGKGTYALYHGNLSVSENEQAALFIIKQFIHKEIHLIVAGKQPSKKIIDLASEKENIQVIPNPDEKQMIQLIKNAHVILLPTFQPTGIKLKLLESLFSGRFCIANPTMVLNTNLEELCIITEKDFYAKAKVLMQKSFSEEDISHRGKALDTFYNNVKNAKVLIATLFKNDDISNPTQNNE